MLNRLHQKLVGGPLFGPRKMSEKCWFPVRFPGPENGTMIRPATTNSLLEPGLARPKFRAGFPDRKRSQKGSPAAEKGRPQPGRKIAAGNNMCGCLSGQSRAVCNQPFSNSRLELGLWYWYSARRRLELGLWSLTSLAQRGWLPLVSGGLAADPFSAPTRPPKAPPRGWLPRKLFFVIAEPPGGGNWHWHSELRRSSSDFGTGTQSCGDRNSDFDTGYSALRRLELGLC